MANSEQKPPPVCKAILLCDTVLVDIESGRTSVIGITDTFRVAAAKLGDDATATGAAAWAQEVTSGTAKR